MSKKLKLSQWHDGSVKPVHVGVYNVICESVRKGESWSFWNGSKWTPQCSTGIHVAELYIHDNSYENQNKKWRGIVK